MLHIRKSILKRFRITKNGKILHSGSGVNHFQAKKGRQKQLSKKRVSDLDKIQKRMVASYLNY